MKKIDQELIDSAISLYVGGESLDECVRQTTVSETTLRRNLAIQDIPLRNAIRYMEKICFSCGDWYMPTGGRQIVCTRSECQAWLTAQGNLMSVPLADYAPHGTLIKYEKAGCKCDLCLGVKRDKSRIDRHQMYPQDYAEILNIQYDQCALCRGPQIGSLAFDVDHSHACTEHDYRRTGNPDKRQSCPRCWRGLLCRVCNQQLERKVGHAYIREIEGISSQEDLIVLEYIRNPPADIWRARHSISQAS